MKIKNKTIKWWQVSLIALAVIFGIFLIYFIALMSGIEGKIVEDRPFMEFVCNARSLCGVGDTALHGCAGLDEIIRTNKLKEYYREKKIGSDTYELARWGGYMGCNESTKGFQEEYGGSIIGIKSCWCEGFFG